MGTRLLRASLPALLAGTFGLQLAHADIYTWVDGSGSINVSNVAPPEGVRVTSITPATPPAAVARADAAREAARQAEVEALAQRVRELEDDVELARRQAPPPVDYRAIPPPPVIQYFVVSPPAQYAPNPAVPANNGWNNGCDPAWTDCGLWGYSGFYPTSVIVLRAPNFRHLHPGRGGHRPPMQPQVRAPGTSRRG
jgi:hypothetical protein